MELDGKAAVITGAAGGIGLGMAKAALGRGMRVMIADLDAARADETATQLREHGASISSAGCDVRDFAQVEALRDAALAELGGIDLWCNNAGIGLARPLPECTAADWELVLDVNLTGVTHGVRAVTPLLIDQGSGHVSATSSLSGIVADPDLTIYNASKFAVVGLMEALALEMRRDHPGVTASVLCPGPVATDLIASSAKALADAGSEGDDPDGDVATYLARGMHPDDVGQLAIDGIAAGHFWLLPHPELTFSLLDARYDAMRRRELAPEEDWTQQQ